MSRDDWAFLAYAATRRGTSRNRLVGSLLAPGIARLRREERAADGRDAEEVD